MSRLKIIDQPTPEAAAEQATLDSVREELAAARGPSFWRSLEELSETPRFQALLHREFPRFASEWTSDLDRRRFLQVSAASLALAGLTGCTRQPPEEIVPYVRQPEQVIPGKPLFYATSVGLGGYALPVLAESHLGRPTRVDGNPDHPSSRGKIDLFAQASVLDLYDPDRLQAVVNRGTIRTWKAAGELLANKIAALRALGGEGFRILTGSVTSPAVANMIQALLAEMPQARWHQYDGLGRDAVYAGTRLAFGQAYEPQYDLTAADVVVTLDSDFLSAGPGSVRYATDAAIRRSPESEGGMSRFYSIETAPTSTGSTADHRLALTPGALHAFLRMLASRAGLGGIPSLDGYASDERLSRFVTAIANDLRAARGRCLVVAGDHLSAEAQAVVHGINAVLGNIGNTVFYTQPVVTSTEDQSASLAALTDEMRQGAVDTLLIMGANPVYDAPSDIAFAEALERVPTSIALAQRADETVSRCTWQLPEAHDLERWGDGRTFDGTVTLQQPLIVPLYEGKSPIEVLAILLGQSTVPARDLLREQHADLDDKAWRRAIHDGFVADSAFVRESPTTVAEAIRTAGKALEGDRGFALSLRLDPTILDGRFANNAWLQECPKPLTKLTWDNALLVSPATFRELGLGEPFSHGDQDARAPMARIAAGDRSIEAPVWALPGHADGCGTLFTGYGRTACGQVGNGAGVDVGPLRTRDASWLLSDVQVTPTGGTYQLASTQDHHAMEGRDLVRMASLASYQHDPEHAFASAHGSLDTSKSIMDRSAEWEYDSYAWGMTIDLNACNGCNACVIACQSENNIPTVGKDQVARGREMHWIRVDRYFTGESEEIQAIVHQPVSCVHCEQAPCEVVCPVAATVHSDEGLNDMVYNRCVGTRYCSNNCPYKVRRFNFLLYADFETPQAQLGRNPDVTVRSRGVMEKCTYCVQRINEARITAKREKRTIRDGEIVSACQSACPADAITFGDINDPDSAVSRAKASPRNYNLLEELGVRPRTSYLAKIRNVNPSLEPPESGHGSAPDHEEAHG